MHNPASYVIVHTSSTAWEATQIQNPIFLTVYLGSDHHRNTNKNTDNLVGQLTNILLDTVLRTKALVRWFKKSYYLSLLLQSKITNSHFNADEILLLKEIIILWKEFPQFGFQGYADYFYVLIGEFLGMKRYKLLNYLGQGT